MNDDFKNLILNFPKPIILINEQSKEVMIANKEFLHLYSMD